MRSYAGTAPLYASFPAHWLTGDHAILCMCRICSDPEFMHSVRQRYDALATMMTPAALLTPTSSPSSYPPSTSSTLPGISQLHLHGHHRLDSVAEIVATATSATMLNVVRDDWHRGRPERANYSKESAMVRLRVNFLPIGCQPFSVVVFFLLASISSTRRMRRIPVRTSPWRAMPRLTLRQPRGVYLPSLPDYHTRARACTAPTRPYPLPETEPVCRGTNHAREAESRLAHASCCPPHPPYHEPLRLHLQ
jgi:hypothetical protein